MRPQQKSVLVFGGSGFVGRALIHELGRAGYTVTVPSRFGFRHRDLRLLPHVRVVELDDEMTEAELAEMMHGHSVVINLVGILNEPRHNGKTFRRVHVKWSKKLMRTADRAGVGRYLHMSALNADPDGPSYYLKSKGKAERWVHDFGVEHDIAVTSFRPSVIFGPGDSFLNRFAGLARWMPGVFPLACANARFAPVFVDDVARRFVEAIADRQTWGKRIDLCGPRDYSLRDLVRYAAETAGHPRWVVGLPDWLARIQAFVLEFAPGKPFTRDNFASLQVDSICPADCPRQPTTLESVAPGYLGRHK